MNRARVLLIDDNPLILDLMKKGLQGFAELIPCADSTQALVQCVSAPPDLVICDYRMPGVDGKQFVEALRKQPQTQSLPVILMAAQSDIDEKLRPLSDTVEEFLVKPFYVREMATRARKVLERIAARKMASSAPPEGVIRGRLAEMNMIDLLQSLELGQKTCALRVVRDAETCKMFFSGGQIVHAELGGVIGDDAVFCVVSWPDGSFEIDFNARSDKQTTTRSTQGLLMEALRLLDEQNRDSAG
ncbi:MAG: DUF4388 domain-containing protein [Acidobacteria bacterium]|nr:DUF4388 domain-containing protein [Acidobacteriota bacterium]